MAITGCADAYRLRNVCNVPTRRSRNPRDSISKRVGYCAFLAIFVYALLFSRLLLSEDENLHWSVPDSCNLRILIVWLLLGSILVNATSRQIGVFQIKILSELVRIKGWEYVGQLAK